MSTAGSVTLIYGSATGLGRAGSRAITQNTPGVPGRTTEQGMFGGSLASADVATHSGPAFDELFVGLNVGLDWRSGEPYSAVLVASGSSAGLDTRNCQLWTSKKLGRVTPGDDLGFGEPILG